MTDEELLMKIEESTRNAVRHQDETLRSILRHQCSTRYLRRYLSADASPADDHAAAFKRTVPLSCYVDYEYYINQMADGGQLDDQPLLSVDPLVCFFYSSGTNSVNMKPKLVPYFDSSLSKAASFIGHQGASAILRRSFPRKCEVNKILSFLYAGNVSTTKGGFKAMAASSYPLLSNTSPALQNLRSPSPREVFFGSNIEQQMYCHLLCSLRNSDLIDGIQAAYAVGLIRAFSLLESKWEQLCKNIEHGILSLEVDDVAMRDSVNEVLGGSHPSLSKRLHLACENDNWEGIVSKLWPNVRYVKCVTTGSMVQYYSKLKFYAGEVPLLGGDYFASECCIGLNLDSKQPPEKSKYVMLPTAAYFEFLPFDTNENKVAREETVDFTGVEVGKFYELVVTTYRGFYRYRLGDIVRVVGFHNLSPELEFVTRAPKTPSDIVSEKDLMSGMNCFQLVLKNVMAAEVVEFTSFMDLEASPKKLKIFIEVGKRHKFLEESTMVALRRCCSSFEDSLGSIYKVQRDRGQLGPLSVSIVKSGTFDTLMLVALKNGTPASQYKPPKIIRNYEIVDFMESSALVTVSLDS